jgi:hypothetical protein
MIIIWQALGKIVKRSFKRCRRDKGVVPDCRHFYKNELSLRSRIEFCSKFSVFLPQCVTHPHKYSFCRRALPLVPSLGRAHHRTPSRIQDRCPTPRRRSTESAGAARRRIRTMMMDRVRRSTRSAMKSGWNPRTILSACLCSVAGSQSRRSRFLRTL